MLMIHIRRLAAVVVLCFMPWSSADVFNLTLIYSVNLSYQYLDISFDRNLAQSFYGCLCQNNNGYCEATLGDIYAYTYPNTRKSLLATSVNEGNAFYQDYSTGPGCFFWTCRFLSNSKIRCSVQYSATCLSYQYSYQIQNVQMTGLPCRVSSCVTFLWTNSYDKLVCVNSYSYDFKCYTGLWCDAETARPTVTPTTRKSTTSSTTGILETGESSASSTTFRTNDSTHTATINNLFPVSTRKESVQSTSKITTEQHVALLPKSYESQNVDHSSTTTVVIVVTCLILILSLFLIAAYTCWKRRSHALENETRNVNLDNPAFKLSNLSVRSTVETANDYSLDGNTFDDPRSESDSKNKTVALSPRERDISKLFKTGSKSRNPVSLEVPDNQTPYITIYNTTDETSDSTNQDSQNIYYSLGGGHLVNVATGSPTFCIASDEHQSKTNTGVSSNNEGEVPILSMNLSIDTSSTQNQNNLYDNYDEESENIYHNLDFVLDDDIHNYNDGDSVHNLAYVPDLEEIYLDGDAFQTLGHTPTGDNVYSFLN